MISSTLRFPSPLREPFYPNLPSLPSVENSVTVTSSARWETTRPQQLIQRRTKRGISEISGSSSLMTAAHLRDGLMRERRFGYSQPSSIQLQDIQEVLELYPSLSDEDRRGASGFILELTRFFQPPANLSPTIRALQQQVQTEFDRLKQPIESNIHFIWTGCLSEKTKTNIEIFLKSNSLSTATPNRSSLSFYLSYDPRGYMAPLLQAAIRRMALADINGLPLGSSRDSRYYFTSIQLQNEAYAYIRPAKTAEEFNQRAIDFMVWRLGQDENVLKKGLNQAQRSFSDFKESTDRKYGNNRLKFVPLDTLIHDAHPLKEYYLQEMWLRGTLAAASDIGRAALLSHYGGTYIDADLSPLLRDGIYNTATIESEINAKLTDCHLKSWASMMGAAKIQSIHNFIASKDSSLSSLASNDIFEKLNEWKNEIPGIRDLIENYIQQIQAAPEKYAQGAHFDVQHFFQPVEQPLILSAGIAMQQRSSLLGYDNSVLHGKKGALAFQRYVQLVRQRYEELRQGGLFWDQGIPRSLDNNSQLKRQYGGYYRLDGLQVGAATTGKVTGPIVFAQAATGSLKDIKNKVLSEKIGSSGKIVDNPAKFPQYNYPSLTDRHALFFC